MQALASVNVEGGVIEWLLSVGTDGMNDSH